jgi:hypothetical protein
MFRPFRRLRLVLPGIFARLCLKIGIKKVPVDADCFNCKYGQNEYECNPPGVIPEAMYEKYDDDQLPKHCGFYKREAINQ